MPASADAIAFDPAPQQIVCGRYELVSELGRGGMGTVWRARNLPLDAPCAIKFMLPELAQKDELRQRFLREARAAAQLHSPHIVHVFDVGDWNGCPFMAMEFMEGESLEAVLEREFKLNYDRTLEIIAQVAAGLETAHARGLVHRDLKPANIFLLRGERTTVKILDFGVAKQTDATSGVKTLHGALLGTPHYMSPEQARGESSLDRRADVWSLGVVAFECLTGRLPFNGDSLPQLLGAILAGEIRGTGVPELEPFWQRASKRDPEQRYQTARDLADGLRGAISGTLSMAPITEVPLDSGVRQSDIEAKVPMHSGLRVVGAIAVLAALGVGAFVTLRGGEAPADAPAGGPVVVNPKPAAGPESEPTHVPTTHADAPAQAPTPTPASAPQPATGFSLSSTPTGAIVIVDGVRSPHRTPVKLTDLAAGPHLVALEKDGFAPWTQKIVVSPGNMLVMPHAMLTATSAPPKPRTTREAPGPRPSPSDRPPSRPERPRLGKYDDAIGF